MDVEYEVTEPAEVASEVGVDVASVSVTGQTVVDRATVTVVREIEFAGQLVTVGAQLVTVDT